VTAPLSLTTSIELPNVDGLPHDRGGARLVVPGVGIEGVAGDLRELLM
jgi:hypothetical protein